MTHRPGFDNFTELAQQAPLVPVFRQLVSDTLTPVSAFCQIRTGGCSFLFESVVGGEKVGRYSFLGADPFLQIEASGNRVTIRRPEKTETFDSADPLQDLERLITGHRSVQLPGLPRFCGGAVGYAGYDTVRYCERLPNAPTDDRHIPDLWFGFFDRMVMFDHINKTILVVALARTDTGDLRAEYDRVAKRIDELCARLQSGSSGLTLTDIDLTDQTPITNVGRSNFTRESFCTAVGKCQEYIKAGDIFQVVISQRWELDTTAKPLDIYRALRVVNPSPFMFLVQTPATDLVGSSPEIMVRVEDGLTTIRPLAGTRRRGKDEADDQRLAAELLADPKERAEHVMLVDLARNDLGRVSKYGSVRISDVMHVERYSHVMHITSNATGILAEGKTSLDALRAGLPAGTVSGAPKVRAMQIIDELEPHRRGPYAGAVGYIDFTGNMDTCIALRTLVMQGGKAYIQAGAGIVADSVPESEYQETASKAQGLLKAIRVAEQQLASAPPLA